MGSSVAGTMTMMIIYDLYEFKEVMRGFLYDCDGMGWDGRGRF